MSLQLLQISFFVNPCYSCRSPSLKNQNSKFKFCDKYLHLLSSSIKLLGKGQMISEYFFLPTKKFDKLTPKEWPNQKNTGTL